MGWCGCECPPTAVCESRAKQSPHANRNRNCGGLQHSVQLRGRDTRGLGSPGGCEQGVPPLPARPGQGEPGTPCSSPGALRRCPGGPGLPPPRGPGLGRRRCRVPSPPTVEPSSNLGPRRSGTGPDRAPRGRRRGSMVSAPGHPLLPGTPFLFSGTPLPGAPDRPQPPRWARLGRAGTCSTRGGAWDLSGGDGFS